YSRTPPARFKRGRGRHGGDDRRTWAKAAPADYTTNMNGGQRPSGERTRHRLLEGALLRLARLPEADEFILRGGMLMRLWFRPLARPAADLDLVSAFPFSVEETAR